MQPAKDTLYKLRIDWSIGCAAIFDNSYLDAHKIVWGFLLTC